MPPIDEMWSSFGTTRATGVQPHVGPMSRLRPFLASYALDALVVLAALTSALGTALRRDPGHPTGALLWIEAVAVAVLVLALLLRRRYPFGAPAATWLLSAALSFVDGRLIVSQGAVFLAGMGAALLGNLQPRVGLGIVLGGAAVIVYNDPLQTPGGLLLHHGAVRDRLAGGLRAARAGRSDGGGGGTRGPRRAPA